jgi:hypothetical protein
VYAALTTATVVTSGTAVAVATLGVGGVKASWYVDIPFIWDSTSLLLQPIGNYSVQAGAVTTATTGTAVTTVALTSLSFGMTYQFATSSTSNVCSAVEISLEQI